MEELKSKLSAVEGLLARHQINALLLQRVSSFAWITGGSASYINTAATEGTASILITPEARYVITNNIEATRLEQEERLQDRGWQFQVDAWHKTPDTIARLVKGLKLGSDMPYPGAQDLSGEIARLRSHLTPDEVSRFRMLGRLCAAGMDSAIRAVRPYMTEHEIAALMEQETQQRGVQPTVCLVATDWRIFSFRHPLPTSKRLERYAMLVLCGRRAGLVCSITRLVHFGPLPEELRRKSEAVACIDAAFIAATRPGRTVGEVFQAGVAAYAQTGYPEEWTLHHQGGPAGYEPREWLATPDTTDVVAAGQVYAWNPSITGVKSEDSILVGEHGTEILTAIDGWPMQEAEAAGAAFQRPQILEIV